MKKELQSVIDYLQAKATDPFPLYIFKKEILHEEPTAEDIEATHNSTWYRQLACEQWADGSWGRFHTMSSKEIKQKFVSAETALIISVDFHFYLLDYSAFVNIDYAGFLWYLR